MNIEEIHIEEYSTKNLNLSAYLSCFKTIQFIGVVKINNEFFFKFAPKSNAEELVNQFFSGTAMVNPRNLGICVWFGINKRMTF